MRRQTSCPDARPWMSVEQARLLTLGPKIAAMARPMAEERRGCSSSANADADRASLLSDIDAAAKQRDFATASRLQQLLDALPAPQEARSCNVAGRRPAEIAQDIEPLPQNVPPCKANSMSRSNKRTTQLLIGCRNSLMPSLRYQRPD